jgi:WbqC-like protein
MIVAIHQPNYIPGLGFFHKMASADVFVLLDNVQYSKNNYTNRNRIRSRDEWAWLTVPVRISGHFGQLISQVETAEDGWETRHWKRLLQEYGQAPYFRQYQAWLQPVYARRRINLAEINCELIEFARVSLGIGARVVRASELAVSGQSSDLLLALCKDLGATTYLSGQGGRKYLDVRKFEAAGIAVEYQEFVHPHYPQGRGGFVPNLSILDLLFHAGVESSAILLGVHAHYADTIL